MSGLFSGTLGGCHRSSRPERRRRRVGRERNPTLLFSVGPHSYCSPASYSAPLLASTFLGGNLAACQQKWPTVALHQTRRGESLVGWKCEIAVIVVLRYHYQYYCVTTLCWPAYTTRPVSTPRGMGYLEGRVGGGGNKIGRARGGKRRAFFYAVNLACKRCEGERVACH